jgi:16S rRNA (guanine1207-N2)-methyltransferase
MSNHSDPALDALFFPFHSGLIPWPNDPVLFLRARHGHALTDPRFSNLICEQTYKPDAQALKNAGFKSARSDQLERYPLVLILLPRQRDEARALLARALQQTQPGGRVVACLANNEGARSSEADLKQLTGSVSCLSKHKCRVFWSAPIDHTVNEALVNEWSALDAPRHIADTRFMSRPGLFAWDRIDQASKLLANHLPSTLAGHAADLGAGFGYLSVELLSRCPHITALDLYEAEARALHLAKHNLRNYAPRIPLQFYWHDVTQGLLQRYQVIITNPPFHTQSRTDRPDIGQRFIAVAAEALLPGGQLWLVANRHLPYEDILRERFNVIQTVAQQDGFKIIAATKNSTAERTLKTQQRHRQ